MKVQYCTLNIAIATTAVKGQGMAILVAILVEYIGQNPYLLLCKMLIKVMHELGNVISNNVAF